MRQQASPAQRELGKSIQGFVEQRAIVVCEWYYSWMISFILLLVHFLSVLM